MRIAPDNYPCIACGRAFITALPECCPDCMRATNNHTRVPRATLRLAIEALETGLGVVLAKDLYDHKRALSALRDAPGEGKP